MRFLPKLYMVHLQIESTQKPKERVADSTIRLLRYNGREAVFEYTGPVDNVIDSIAYTSSGEIVNGNLAWNQVGDAMHLRFTCGKNIQKIKLFLASAIINQKLNFKLNFAEEKN